MTGRGAACSRRPAPRLRSVNEFSEQSRKGIRSAREAAGPETASRLAAPGQRSAYEREILQVVARRR